MNNVINDKLKSNQLELDFNSFELNNKHSEKGSKVININHFKIAERREITREILRHTKSF